MKTTRKESKSALEQEKRLEMLAEKFKGIAESLSEEHRYIFESTLATYFQLIKNFKTLKEALDADGCLITMEYVKGRQNVCIHPAMSEMNKTVNILNSTAKTLIAIIKDLGAENKEEVDELMAFTNEDV
ncbi:hypothetical protein ACR77V_13250 [Staphylococcus epidermidis]|uniref:hypothetical protein n=1 Tax=Staphylococcus epidermidis TaxID=1282 RepID=UPI003DA515CB